MYKADMSIEKYLCRVTEKAEYTSNREALLAAFLDFEGGVDNNVKDDPTGIGHNRNFGVFATTHIIILKNYGSEEHL